MNLTPTINQLNLLTMAYQRKQNSRNYTVCLFEFLLIVDYLLTFVCATHERYGPTARSPCPYISQAGPRLCRGMFESSSGTYHRFSRLVVVFLDTIFAFRCSLDSLN